MQVTFKYAIVLAAGLMIGFLAHAAPRLAGFGNLRWIGDVKSWADRAFPASRAADAIPIDQSAAAAVNEELDYRIAQRIGTLDRWRAFLATHGKGPYAQAAKGEIERLLSAGKRDFSVAAGDLASSADGKSLSEALAGDQPSAAPVAAAPALVVAGDGAKASQAPCVEKLLLQDGSGVLSGSLSSSKGRPSVPAPVMPQGEVAAPDAVSQTAVVNKAARAEVPTSRLSAKSIEGPFVGTKRALPFWGGAEPAASRRRRHANRCASARGCFVGSSSLPPILLALLGERPRSLRALALYPRKPVAFRER